MKRWLCEHETLVDSVLAAVLVMVALIAVRVIDVGTGPVGDGARRPNGWTDVLLVAVLAPIALRRRFPVAVYLVTAAAALGLWSMNSIDGGSAIAGVFVTYGLGFYVSRARGFRVFVAVATVLSGAAIVLAIVYDTEGRWFQSATRIAVVLGPYFFGDSRRTRNELVESLRERARRAEEDQARDAHQAVADERARIAHELHDVVAHSLSVMVVQAAAGQRLVTRNPDRAAESMASVAETGRAALGEMRRILGVLDTRPGGEHGTQELSPQPGLGDIDELIERCRSAGMRINYAHHGVDASLEAGVQLAVYRVVQEALTNVLKHAGSATVTVSLNIDDAARVEIADDGVGLAAAKADGRGRGVIGMRARVESVGGAFHAGARPGGGWVVRASIPVSKHVHHAVASA
jgi:signal transduction histidine kinase